MKIQVTSHGVARSERKPTEDAWRVEERDDVLIAALADGVGAARDGGEAAHRAVHMIIDYFLARPRAWSSRRALTEFAGQINRIFFQESQLRHGSSEMLSTLSVVALENGRLYGLNVGDSPIFLWRQGTLTRLSENHALSEKGYQHILTRAVGLELAVDAYVFEHELQSGDRLLLCSDGVTAVFDEPTLGHLLAGPATARTLVAQAHERASRNSELQDDASAVMIEIAGHGWRGSVERSLEVTGTLHVGMQFDDHTLERPLDDSKRVWLGRAGSGSPCVLKFPPLDAADGEALREAFLREAWRATRIDSPLFVRASLPEGNKLLYYKMEYIEAPTLRERLQSGRVSVEEALSLGRFLLAAGQFLITRDLVHGDIKPENILFTGPRPVDGFKILDLGSVAELFSVTNRAGTPSYLAPERFRGAPISERSEVYSIAVTLYEALAGTYPHGEIERFQTPRFDSPPRRLSKLNPAVPSWLETVLYRGLEADAERRYQSFSEMLYDLEHPDSVQPHHAKDAPLLERNPLLVYKVLCLVLLAANVFLLARLSLR